MIGMAGTSGWGGRLRRHRAGLGAAARRRVGARPGRPSGRWASGAGGVARPASAARPVPVSSTSRGLPTPSGTETSPRATRRRASAQPTSQPARCRSPACSSSRSCASASSSATVRRRSFGGRPQAETGVARPPGGLAAGVWTTDPGWGTVPSACGAKCGGSGRVPGAGVWPLTLSPVGRARLWRGPGPAARGRGTGRPGPAGRRAAVAPARGRRPRGARGRWGGW